MEKAEKVKLRNEGYPVPLRITPFSTKQLLIYTDMMASQTETIGSESFTKTYTYDSYGRVEYENWHTGFGIRNVSYTYFWLDPKVPKDQGYIKISCFLQLGFHARYKPRKRTIRRMLLYRLILYSLKYPDGNPHFENQRNLYEASHTSQESAVRFCLRGGPKVWRVTNPDIYRQMAEWACVVGASNFLDFFVLFYQEKRTRKDYRNTDYADNGNIEERTDIGIYNYGAQNAGPHAVTSLSNTTGTLLSTTSQAVDYTTFNKASHITQGNKDYFITYGPDRLRTKTSLQSGIGDDVLLTKYYAFGDFERETDANGTRQLHYIAAGDGLAAIYVKYDTGADSLFYIMQDHLGSLVGAINAESDHVYRQSCDAWGRERNPTTWGYTNLPDDFPFLRGYTGHEHLKWFGLINMNGRIYDPALCRFLSPDPYVQMPDNSQNFNRYSYCLNNPLIYTDPSGEFFVWDSWLVGLVDGFFSSGSNRFDNAWDEANLRAGNDIKIWGGLVATDENKTFGGQVWEVFSRFTWQLPQTIGGFGTAHSYNTFGLDGGVESVDYAFGATVVKTRSDGYWGVSQGNFIVGSKFIEAKPNNSLFQHEYGHYIQSQKVGWFYYSKYGIPSLLSKRGVDHSLHPVEQDANVRAFKYFNENIDNYSGWLHTGRKGNPIVGYNPHKPYDNESNQVALNKRLLRLKWYDYALSPLNLTLIGIPIPGLINAFILNKKY